MKCCAENFENVFCFEEKKFKTVSLSVVIRIPLERKFVTYNALLPYVLKRGCEKFDTMRKINVKTEKMLGAVFDANVVKKGEQQILQFFIEVIDKKEIVEEAVEFLSEIILKPLVYGNSFCKDYVESEKEFLKNEILGRKNDKREYAKLKCIEIMCCGEAFGIYGDGYAEDLDDINEENLYRHYCDVIEKYSLEFYAVGNISKEKYFEILQKYFDLKNYSKIAFENNIVYSKKEVRELMEEDYLSQGKLCIGMRCDVVPSNDDFYKLIVANEIFGGGANSKLFAKIREENGLCYYINSFVYKFKSIILIQAGIESKDYKKVISLIKKYIDEISLGHFSDEDFESAVLGLIKKYEGIIDYPSGIMDFYLSQNMIGTNQDLNAVLKKIKNVLKDDILAIMKKTYIDTIYFLY